VSKETLRGETIEDLRELLFKTARRLSDATSEELDAELLRARGIGDISKVIVDTARVEVAREKATGQPSGSRFLPARTEDLPQPPAPRRLVG
jgi:hypothetical protein